MRTPKSSRPARSHAAYALHAHAHHVELDPGDAFVPDYRRGFVAPADEEAEAFGEEFICSATSAEPVAESARDEVVADELEGLRVETFETFESVDGSGE